MLYPLCSTYYGLPTMLYPLCQRLDPGSGNLVVGHHDLVKDILDIAGTAATHSHNSWRIMALLRHTCIVIPESDEQRVLVVYVFNRVQVVFPGVAVRVAVV